MKSQRAVWEKPWKYIEGIIISIGLLMLGFSMEYFGGGQGISHLVAYPFNLYLGAGIMLILIFLSFFGRGWALVEWLESVPAAISSIVLLLVVTMLMGFILQHDDSSSGLIRKLGLSHMVTSWSYLFANLFLLLSLGLVTIKNIKSFQLKKAGFIVSHLGLWLVLFGANFGSSQLIRLQMEIREGAISNKAIDPITNTAIELPFAIRLEDFILEEYNPKLVVVNNNTGKLLHGNGKNVFLIDSSASGNLLGWQISIEAFIHTSAKAGNKYYFNNETGSAPSVFVKAIDERGVTAEGWVSCGSFNRQYESLKLNEDYSLVMMFPEPKEYTSEIVVFHKKKNPQSINLQVNKPHSVEGWKIYQLSYDTELGRWSDVSVIELIKDPWLPLVYVGIYLMLIGAVYMFWTGARTKSKSNNN